MAKRRAISSLVGALLFTVLMIAGFSTLSLALDAQTDIVNTHRMISSNELKKQQERFTISASTDENNLLQLYVNNRGQNPLELSSLWIINKTLTDQPATRFLIDSQDSYVPGGYGAQVLSSQPLSIQPDKYDIKLVSSLGTIEVTELDTTNSGGGGGGILNAKLFSIPPDIIAGQNATIALLVTNKGLDTIKDVTPATPLFVPSNAMMSPFPPNPSPVDLASTESVLFTWDYKASGNLGTIVTFTGSATGLDLDDNPITSNISTDTLVLHENTDDLNVINKELISRPEIFIIKPSPFGDSSSKGLWGVNIVNPTNQPMEVSKITISLISPRAQSNDLIFDPGGGSYCAPENISPLPTNYWSCPSANQLMWKSTTSQTIDPISVYSFLVKVKPGSLATASVDLESIIVHVSVFTNVGEFGKAGYGTSMRNQGDVIANVYLSTIANSTSNNDIRGSRTGILSGTEQTFNIVMTDFDTAANYIQSNSRIIINVPKGWSNITIDQHGGFNTPTVNSFSDGSHQIVATLTNNLAGNDSKTIKFRATAPTVDSSQLYVMYVLGEGDTGNGFAIGPLNETLLQVCPTSGCP